MSKRIDRRLNPEFKGAKLNIDWAEIHRRNYRRGRVRRFVVRTVLTAVVVIAIHILYDGQSKCEATHGVGSIHCVD